MYVIIIGGGNVGRHVAKSLLEKKQDVLLIDKDEKAIEAIRSELDINIIHGNGASVEVLEKAKIDTADILISLMENDDGNILASMLAKTFSKKITTIARVRNPESAGSIDVDAYGLTRKQVGLDVIISPQQAVAEEMVKNIYFPDLDEVDYFAEEKVKLIGFVIKESSKINGKSIGEVDLPKDVKIVGVSNGKGKFTFSSDKDIVRQGDKVYFLGTIEAVRNISKLLYDQESLIKRVLILGGGKTGHTLAGALESGKERSFVTKLIETDPQRCEKLNQNLKKTLIIQGGGNEDSYYNEEEIREADVLVTATGDDRINLIASVIGKEAGVSKIINALESTEYASVYPKMGLKTVINPQLITARKIMRYIHKEKVVSLAVLEEENVEVFEVVLEGGCKVEGKTIEEVGFPKEVLIGAILREGSVITPDKKTVLEGNDHLIVVASGKISLTMDEYFVCK
jgi:trk system potassium uptake protein